MMNEVKKILESFCIKEVHGGLKEVAQQGLGSTFFCLIEESKTIVGFISKAQKWFFIAPINESETLFLFERNGTTETEELFVLKKTLVRFINRETFPSLTKNRTKSDRKLPKSPRLL